MLFGRDTLLDPITKSEMDRYSLSPGQALYDSEGNLITESPGERLEDIERIYGLKLSPGQTAYDAEGNQVGPIRGQISDYEQGLLKLNPGQALYDAEGNVVTEDQLPYDPDKGYTENLNELMTDIGGTIKEKVKGAGKSVLDKINDFLKYGRGDPENQWKGNPYELNEFEFNLLHPRVDFESTLPEERTIDTEGEEYRRLNELLDQLRGEGFRRGGIVSLNHITRAL